MRASHALWSLLGLTLVLAGTAVGQSAVDLEMTVSEGSVELDPGQASELTLTLTNAGMADGTATLTLDVDSQAWTAALGQETVEVQAGSSATVPLTLTAPAERPDGTGAALVNVGATLTDTSGQFSDDAEVAVQGELTPAPPPPPEPFPWMATIGGLVGVLVVGSAGTAWWMTRKRETGIALEAQQAAETRAGGRALVPVRVTNTSDRPRVAKLEVQDAPKGWSAATNRPTVPLDPGETEQLWLAVRPPEDATGGSGEVTLGAKPAEAKTFRSKVTVRIEVVDKGLISGPQLEMLRQQPAPADH